MVIIKKDLNLVREVVKEELADFKEDFRDEMGEMMDQKFTNFKSEILSHIDAYAKEKKDSETERIITSKQISDLDDRVSNLESTHS